jgi:ABC-2 type transport system ATP-binding protein
MIKMSQVTAITALGLTKYYGDFLAVDHISFDVDQGEIFGFLGPNGAGKSTTIRMLTGISTPTEGTASISGFDIIKHSVEAKSQMGIVPDISNIYTELTAWQNLDFTGKLYGVPKAKREEKAIDLLTRFDLYDRRNEKVEGFSRGMRRRVCIAMALINDSKVLFLDEPTSGLDVKSVRGIRELIRELNEEGLTTFLTTHNIEEASQMCDRVAIINRGKIAAIDTPEKLKRVMKSSQSIEVSFRETCPEAIKELATLQSVNSIQKRGDKLHLMTENPSKALRELGKYIEDHNLEPITINTLGPSLEDAFLQLTGTKMAKEIMRKRGRGS